MGYRRQVVPSWDSVAPPRASWSIPKLSIRSIQLNALLSRPSYCKYKKQKPHLPK